MGAFRGAIEIVSNRASRSVCRIGAEVGRWAKWPTCRPLWLPY